MQHSLRQQLCTNGGTYLTLESDIFYNKTMILKYKHFQSEMPEKLFTASSFTLYY